METAWFRPTFRIYFAYTVAHLSALEVRFSQRGAIQIYVYLYLYLYTSQYHTVCTLLLNLS